MNRASIALVVLLRMAIGWHFLYEGVWKIRSEDTGAQYHTSRYFLQASVGRLRDALSEAQSGALAPAAAEARIDKWNDEIVSYFKSVMNPLGEDQIAALALVRDDLKRALAEPAQVERALNFDWYTLHEQVLNLAGEKDGRQYFTSLEYLQGASGPFRRAFRGIVPDIAGVERLTRASTEARLEARYAEILDHYAAHGQAFTQDQRSRLALARDGLKRSASAILDDPLFKARLADYKLMLGEMRRYESDIPAPFAKERADAYRKRLDAIGGELLGFVNEPLIELTLQAEAIATPQQMAAGPAPHLREQTEWIDWAMKWGLTAIGLCLLLGLFTRAAGIAAAGQLAVFFLASPPFPGLPAASMGGHFLYVDRNLIEMIAVALVAAAGAGRWAGLDAWVSAFKARPSHNRADRSLTVAAR